MQVARIAVYPVKSMAGAGVDDAAVEPWGLAGDRRWIAVEPDGTVVTAREEHALLGITARPTPEEGGIVLRDRAGATMHVATPRAGETMPVSLSRLDTVRAAGREADAWLTERLGRDVRLGWLDDPRRRSVSVSHGGRTGDTLSLADAGPLLLATTASLLRLESWIAERGEGAPIPLAMNRFRPNVVVDGVEDPFAEDGWRRIRIGEVELRFAEHCDRCVPETLLGGKEPLRSLARHRRWKGKTWFGVRLIPIETGRIRVGDPVRISHSPA